MSLSARIPPPGPLSVAEELRVRFFDDLDGLTLAQWSAIAQRFQDAQGLLAANRTRFAKALHATVFAQADQRQDFQAHTIAFNRWAHDRAQRIVGALPEQAPVGGRTAPLRALAMAATQGADAALRLFEEPLVVKSSPALAAPALRPFAGYAALPPLPSDAPATRRALAGRQHATGRPAEAGAVFHLRFPDDYFTYGEPLPPGVRTAPLWWNRRNTHHETWTLAPAAGMLCAFGGPDRGRCAVCGRGLHHLVTLPRRVAVAGPGTAGLGVATCLSCLGWQQPQLFFRHDGRGAPTPLAATSAEARGVEEALRGEALRPARVRLCATPARWTRQPWGDSDGQNLNRIGGRPSWVQDSERFTCPACRKRMAFLLQLDSELPTATGKRWRWGSGGMVYVFWCAPCRVSGQAWQCT